MINGFTLVELLVVIAVLGIAAGVVALCIPSREGREVDEEIRRLATLFALAQDQARVSGSTLVWEASSTGYRFHSLGDAADDHMFLRDSPLHARAWPFPVARIQPDKITFGREPLLNPALVVLTTDKREIKIALDPMGKLSLLR